MKNIAIDHVTRTITVTKRFLEAAAIPFSEECNMLNNLQKEFPQMRIVTRNLKPRKVSNKNKGLTYKYMRNFIDIMDKENLPEFVRVQVELEALYENAALVYKNMRDWFLEQYPYHEEMIVNHISSKPVKNNIIPLNNNCGSSQQIAE